MAKYDRDTRIKVLEEKFQTEISQISELDKKSCNVFNIVGCERDELKHSVFTRWLLYNDAFYKRFLILCGIKLTPEQLNEPRYIKKEEYFNVDDLHDSGIPISKDLYDENSNGRRIDLNIIGKTYSITIENKVDSSQHNDQCLSYYNYMMDKDGKYGNIADKYFVLLVKNDIEDFEKRGGLVRKKGEEIVEHNPDCLIKNLTAICEQKNNDTVKKELETELVGAPEKEKNKIKKKIKERVEEIELQKQIYFNYRLFGYKDIRNLMENPNFEGDFIENYKNDNKDKWTEDEIVFLKQILKQYLSVINEWIELPSVFRDVFEKNLDDEKIELLFEINDNYNELYRGEEDSDIGRFLDIARRYYLHRKAIIDTQIGKILGDLAKERDDLDLNSYSESYGKSIKVQCPPLSKYMNTIDYVALNKICVRMIAGLNFDKSRDLIKYFHSCIEKSDFRDWYNDCKDECEIKLGWSLWKTPEGSGSSNKITFIEYDIEKILGKIVELKSNNKLETLFPIEKKDKNIFVEKFYINYEERKKMAEEKRKKNAEDGQKTHKTNYYSLLLNGQNRLIDFIDDNNEYIKDVETIKAAITEYQENNKDNVTGMFAAKFELEVVHEYRGNEDDNKELKKFFEEATDKAVRVFGTNKDDIFKYKTC